MMDKIIIVVANVYYGEGVVHRRYIWQAAKDRGHSQSDRGVRPMHPRLRPCPHLPI